MNTQIKIEKGVPIEPSHRAKTVYPWRDMEVGDSFFTERAQSVVTNARTNATRKTGFKFATRKVDGGTRVWRVA